MVKFYESYFSYDFAWPAVTLAYFLRYPNPYAAHVLSSDTLSRHLDPATGKLHTVRLHLKRGKLPAAVARFLPKIKESYILERSVVDIRNQTMETETRNLDWEGVISVVESQLYTPSAPAVDGSAVDGDKTDVKLTVKISSRVGSNAREKVADAAASGSTWTSWTTGSLQKSIEIVGMKRMREGLGRSKEGMKIVLEGLREKGLIVAMQERRERKLADRKEEGVQSRWANIWNGARVNSGEQLGKDSDN